MVVDGSVHGIVDVYWNNADGLVWISQCRPKGGETHNVMLSGKEVSVLIAALQKLADGHEDHSRGPSAGTADAECRDWKLAHDRLRFRVDRKRDR